MDPDYYEDIEKQLSPIQASASLVNPQKRTIVASQYEKKSSPKKVCFTTQNITSPNQASPKKVCFTTKNITSPNRATLNVQQKEILFESEDRDSSNEIFPKDDDNSRDPIQNEGAFQTYPIQSEGLTFTASPQKRSSTFPHYEQMDEDDSEDESLIPEVRLPPGLASPVHAAVSSSQPTMGGLDQFDNLLLSKAQQNAPLDVCIFLIFIVYKFDVQSDLFLIFKYFCNCKAGKQISRLTCLMGGYVHVKGITIFT